MLYFPHCKINLGLLVTEKRADDFHNIETIFYPVGMQDVLEFVENDVFQFAVSGIELEGDATNNLVVRAYRLLEKDFKLPPLHIHLHKNIPSGAGLGGGSADAAFMLTALNDYFGIGLSQQQLTNYALRLGSDCPFFISPVPSLAKGRGELLEPIELDLSGMHLVVVKPPIHVSTAEAYSHIIPKQPDNSLANLIAMPVNQWKNYIFNQFEDYVFDAYPEVKAIKQKLYQQGACFSLMSGSGSAVFALFKDKPNTEGIFPDSYSVFYQLLQ